MSKRHLNVKAISLAAAMAAPVIGFAAVSTWTGPGTSWNDATNWDSNPSLPDDVAALTTAVGTGSTISLDAGQTINELSIGTTNGFTIGSAADKTAGYGLSLSKVTRQDVSGTEANQTLAAAVALTSDSVWDVAGDGYLAATGVISGSFGLTKQGSGELRLGAVNLYTGDTNVTAGRLTLGIGSAIKGNLNVGGGATPATVLASVAESVTGSKVLTAKSNGTIDLNSKNIGSGRLAGLAVEAGGSIVNGSYTYLNTLRTTGGTISGASFIFGYPQSITAVASNSTAKISGGFSLSSYYDTAISVADGGAVVDLELAVAMSTNGSPGSKKITKSGAGVLLLSNAGGSSWGGTGGFQITGGTVLANNKTGSATGKNAVTVGGNCTLGGTGIIGGVDAGYAAADVTLTGSSATALATLAPGSIDATSGVALVGTLTVGSAAQANDVTFGNNSRLLAQLSDAGTGDKLAVYGDLYLASAGSSDSLAMSTVSGATLAGEYVLVSFSGTLTGRFDSVTLDGGGLGAYELLYRDSTGAAVLTADPIIGGGSVVLAIPEPASATLVVGGLVAGLALRRRSVRL